VGLGRIAYRISSGLQHELQQRAVVEARAADEEVVRRPFAVGVLPPGLAQPVPVGLEAPRGQHAGSGLETLLHALRAPDEGRHEAAVAQLQPHDGGLIADLYAELLRAAVVGVDQGLAAAHEKGVGASRVQRT